jgi:hypothetical protein
MSHFRPSAPLRPLALLSACLFLAVPAQAQDPVSGSFLLDTEIYRGLEAAFGEVVVEENGVGGLHVTVMLDPAVVGDDARVHRVYVSMPELFEGMEVVADDPDAFKMSVHPQHHAWHTMGAEFGTVVTISPRHRRRSHRWHHRNHEPLQEIGFTLMADKPVMLGSVLGMTATWRDVVTQIAVDVHDLDVGRRHGGHGLLAGLFEADLPPVDDEGPPPDDEETPPTDDEELPPPDDGTVPPGCLGVLDPVTGQVVSIICP